MKKYQKPSFEAIQYDVEEILTASGNGLIYDPNNPSPPDDNLGPDDSWGDLFG